jgi:hypothetical protein
MADGSQSRPPPPPSLESAEYLQALDEVARLGRFESPWRTKEQSQIALFWADGAGTSTPPGHWLLVASRLASERDLPFTRAADSSPCWAWPWLTRRSSPGTASIPTIIGDRSRGFGTRPWTAGAAAPDSLAEEMIHQYCERISVRRHPLLGPRRRHRLFCRLGGELVGCLVLAADDLVRGAPGRCSSFSGKWNPCWQSRGDPCYNLRRARDPGRRSLIAKRILLPEGFESAP